MERRTFFKKGTALPMSAVLGTSMLNALSLIDTTINSAEPYHYKPSLEKARKLPGLLLNFIVDKEQTNGAYSVIEGRARKGAEPSLHVHEYEDEAFYMIDGEMIVTIGKEDYHVRPGDFIFLPRKIPHTQKFISETVHVLLYASPGGLEGYFKALSMPAGDFEIPNISSEPPSEEMLKMIDRVNKQYGISMIT